MADNNEKTMLEELESLRAEKYNLLKLVSHDIRSPFNRVYALLQLLEMEGEGLSDEGKVYIHSMYLSILSGLEMIQNLRDMREIDAGKIKFDKEQVELVSTIDKLTRGFSQRLEIKKLSISFNHDLKQAYIPGDGYYVSRILENLISNAIKFSKNYAKVTVLLNANDKGYEVVVKDTGEGIKEAEEPFLFRKFKKLSTVPTGGEGSVGLGLYNAAFFANKMGATISLRRAKEMGSSFVVQFVNE